jgi:hypothetical protein
VSKNARVVTPRPSAALVSTARRAAPRLLPASAADPAAWALASAVARASPPLRTSRPGPILASCGTGAAAKKGEAAAAGPDTEAASAWYWCTVSIAAQQAVSSSRDAYET